MALDKLLENEAQAEIERIRADARAEAERILAAARTEAEELLGSRSRVLDKQYQAGLTRARSSADLDLNAARLSASEEGIAQVYGLVEQQLRDIGQLPAYREILGRLLNEARQAVPQADVAEVNPSDVEMLRSMVSDLEVRGNPSIEGGVRLLAQGGKSGITNTLMGRLQTLRGSLTPQIRSLLTGE
ncbi:V-type ATP synthase subunit E [Deinococcus radiophilus]|uniref:V-type ATP synthase subunit E n=1 Tax=Deinococcus radiophilus TaxID=32062 RepID=A0A431W2Y6_9DEIO|nr:V-type ATP synthase subunit E [Deinococcus radiophilus]RTR29819.1 V-type ATP synthase subunit E [Deinococcus radiophilus]UFA49831.1 V-type ATP synthase subunit E [Deinococcus radiophilus]